MPTGVEKVNGSGASGNADRNVQSRPEQIVVKRGDTVSSLAKKFGMSPKEFMDWTGLKKSQIDLGQKIALPTDEVPKGKGIMALARKYNMTLEEFGKLNNLPKPYKQYSASKDEKFYIIPDKSDKSANTVKSDKPENKPVSTSTPAPPRKAEGNESSNETKIPTAAEVAAKLGAEALNAVTENKKKWGSSYTPKDLAENIFTKSKEHWGAVGKPDFDGLIDEINPKNVVEVIKAYTENEENKKKESLINTITSEVHSKPESRKQAVMKIYDALAKAKGTPESNRAEFESELNNEFKSWGLVDTKKMDAMIDKMISGEITAKQSVQGSKNNSPVKLTENSKPFTVASLQKGAIHSAKKEAVKKFKEFCAANGIKYSEDKLDLGPMERIPEPNVKGSSIVAAETTVLKPTTKSNGKVVVLNPGHGGYSSRSGYFDPGSYSFIKKANGKYAPLLEYEKMKNYAESTAEKLRARGYAVVITSAHAETLSDQKSISNVVTNLNNGKKDGKKYDKKDIVFISLHADSEPGKTGTGICYDSSGQDSFLSSALTKNLNSDDWIKAGESVRKWGKNGLQVLHQTEQNPSVLVEVEYVNGAKSKNLESSAFQERFENKLVDGLDEYFGLY